MFSESTWTNKVYIDYYHNLNESQFCICFSKINIIKQDFNSHPVYWLSMGIHQANDYPKPALPVLDSWHVTGKSTFLFLWTIGTLWNPMILLKK